ncbi:MAG: ATP synthase subunit I [Candidatus Kryptonium sp.]|nr:ATP synthase subunit I [Candidatus Kryptonium sp.]MCX7762307.1 ATP synthase subunit I [Candidatus Kryptonium sp.]MDW8109029.1 ATP synthase subunit I [Candidatus Kryptonium sp.]
MKVDVGKFVKYILISLVIVWALLIYPLARFASDEFIKSFFIGSLISVVNSIIGILILKRGLNRPDKEFLKLTLGSMGVRLFAIAGLILFMLEVLNFELYGLVISLLLFYFVFLGVEVFFLSKLTTKKEF